MAKADLPVRGTQTGTFKTARETVLQERMRRDPQWFVFTSGLVTKDEHDPASPLKPFPDEPYLRVLLDVCCVAGKIYPPSEAVYASGASERAWLAAVAETGIVLVEKSRQVMATWLVCAYALWRAKARPHQLILVQSKREDDAANLVFVKETWQARMSCMETHLPPYLKTAIWPRAGSYAQLAFPNGSRIWGIPEGGDIVRSNTASVILSDEAAFQPEFGASFTAALPAIKGGGSYIAISSAEPGTFQDLTEAA